MLSIAELAQRRDPKAIAEIICQELESLGINGLDVDVDIIDSSLELQIRTNTAIDKEKLLTLVHSKLENLHIESVAKLRLHCWRDDDEMHEQRLLWTEQIMLNLPVASQTPPSSLESDLDNQKSSDLRVPEPKLSKHSVLRNAIAKIAPNSHQAKQELLANDQEIKPVGEDISSKYSSPALVPTHRKNTQTSDSSNYFQLALVGLSIVLIGLGIGASVRAITSSMSGSSQSPLASAGSSVQPSLIKSSTSTVPNIPNQIKETAPVSQSPAKITAAVVEPTPSSQNVNDQEKIVTLEKFNRIQKGMSIEQVEKVFGSSGQVIAENNSSNSIGQVYSWKNPQGSNAIIELKDGQVVAKAQSGL